MRDSDVSGPFRLFDWSSRTAVVVLFVLGGILAAVLLFDVYVDWAQQGDPLWSTLLENSVPALLALALPYSGWWLLRTYPDSIRLPKAAQWATVGAVGMSFISGLVLQLQLLQQNVKPVIIVLQLASVGAVAGLGVGYNLGRVKEAEQEAIDERDRLANLLDGLPAPVVHGTFVDGEFRVLRVNTAFEDVFGSEFEEIEEGNLNDLVGAKRTGPNSSEIDRSALQDGPVETEVRTRTTDGPRHFQLRIARALDNGSEETYAIYTDITAHKEYERQIEQAKAELERSNRSLREFASIASHDLQEPLRMVSSYVGLLEDEYGDRLDAEGKEYVEFAVDGAQRMKRMINSLLQYSRVQTRAGPMGATDANDVIKDVRRDLGLLIDEHDASLDVENLPTVQADREQLAEALRNLVENAIQHGGYETEPPNVDVRATERTDAYEFAVVDNGAGIPEDEQEEVFKIFRQGAEATETSDGTGIGLAITRRIVERHGGDIWLESEAGEGATFKFTIPKNPADE